MKNPPEVVVFACNWNGLSCIEAAAQEGLCYPASVKVVRVSCLSRVHLGLMLKAFQVGADGVMLLGCQQGECHYDIGTECIDQELEKAQGILRLMGLRAERVTLISMPRGDGAGFVDKVNNFISQISDKGSPGTAAS